MKFSVLFLIFSILNPVLSGNTDDEQRSASPVSSPQFNSMNISSFNKYDFAFVDRTVLDDVDIEMIKARPESNVTRIMDYKTLIWEGKHPFTVCTLVYAEGEPSMLLIENGVEPRRFYYKDDGKWNETDEKAYDQKLRSLRDSVPLRENFSLNLRYHFPNSKYTVELNPKRFVILAIFTPKMGFKARVVYEGTRVVWRSILPSERCTTAICYFKGQVPLLCQLFISSDGPQKNLFFRNDNNEWTPITEQTYESEVQKLRFDPGHFESIHMDLLFFDPWRLTKVNPNYERPFVTFFPKEGSKITILSESDNVIWKSPDEKMFFCHSVSYLNKFGDPILVLNLNHNGPEFKIYFIKKGDKWVRTSSQTVFERVSLLKEERTSHLDISNIDPSMVNICESLHDGVPYKLVGPKVNKDIITISDGLQKIWFYQGLECYFSYMRMFHFKEQPVLVGILTLDPLMGHVEHDYFNLEGVWIPVTKDEYVKILNKIIYAVKNGLESYDTDSIVEDLEASETEHSSEFKTATSDSDSEITESLYSTGVTDEQVEKELEKFEEVQKSSSEDEKDDTFTIHKDDSDEDIVRTFEPLTIKSEDKPEVKTPHVTFATPERRTPKKPLETIIEMPEPTTADEHLPKKPRSPHPKVDPTLKRPKTPEIKLPYELTQEQRMKIMQDTMEEESEMTYEQRMKVMEEAMAEPEDLPAKEVDKPKRTKVKYSEPKGVRDDSAFLSTKHSDVHRSMIDIPREVEKEFVKDQSHLRKHKSSIDLTETERRKLSSDSEHDDEMAPLVKPKKSSFKVPTLVSLFVISVVVLSL